MAWNGISITDCDGHLVESIPEMVDYLDPLIRPVVTRQSRQRQGLFPSLDGYHYPGNEETAFGESIGRVRASDHRTGSGEDILAFLEKSDVQDTVIFPSEGLAVGNIGLPEYAVRVCRGYNDYVADRFARISPRIRPMALIPMQDVPAAVEELRRAVRELGLVGAMLPSTGMPVHLAHELYWPIYKEAADLGCALGVHGGANVNIGMLSTFRSRLGARLLWHPMPLMEALVAFIYHGVLDEYPDLHVAFMEGGCSWTVPVFDRMVRDSHFYSGAQRRLEDYLSGGQILVGCEGNEDSLPYLAKQVGIEAYAWASDYPHEVDLPGARQMIEETLATDTLTRDEQAAVLGGNARRFFRL